MIRLPFKVVVFFQRAGQTKAMALKWKYEMRQQSNGTTGDSLLPGSIPLTPLENSTNAFLHGVRKTCRDFFGEETISNPPDKRARFSILHPSDVKEDFESFSCFSTETEKSTRVLRREPTDVFVNSARPENVEMETPAHIRKGRSLDNWNNEVIQNTAALRKLTAASAIPLDNRFPRRTFRARRYSCVERFQIYDNSCMDLVDEEDIETDQMDI